MNVMFRYVPLNLLFTDRNSLDFHCRAERVIVPHRVQVSVPSRIQGLPSAIREHFIFTLSTPVCTDELMLPLQAAGASPRRSFGISPSPPSKFLHKPHVAIPFINFLWYLICYAHIPVLISGNVSFGALPGSALQKRRLEQISGQSFCQEWQYTAFRCYANVAVQHGNLGGHRWPCRLQRHHPHGQDCITTCEPCSSSQGVVCAGAMLLLSGGLCQGACPKSPSHPVVEPGVLHAFRRKASDAV